MALRLDNQRLAIRERGFVEVFDLALSVIRDRGWGLQAAVATGALPMILLNYWLLRDTIGPHVFAEGDVPLAYLAWMMVLLALETPLAMALATIYLGQSTFEDRPSPRLVAREFVATLPQLLWYQGVVRMLLLPIFLLPYYLRPYLTEIIVLERNPYNGGETNVLTTARRAETLHSGYLGDQIGYWLGSLVIASILAGSLTFASSTLWAQLVGRQMTDEVFYFVLVPVVIWAVAGYLTVTRFLFYLDRRIRNEGWEVELDMRVEAGKLTRQAA